MRDQGDDLSGAFLLDELGGAGDGVGGVCEVVDEDSCAIPYVADKHHGRILAVCDLCWAAFLDNVR